MNEVKSWGRLRKVAGVEPPLSGVAKQNRVSQARLVFRKAFYRAHFSKYEKIDSRGGSNPDVA
jgi:hypothetical protein